MSMHVPYILRVSSKLPHPRNELSTTQCPSSCTRERPLLSDSTQYRKKPRIINRMNRILLIGIVNFAKYQHLNFPHFTYMTPLIQFVYIYIYIYTPTTFFFFFIKNSNFLLTVNYSENYSTTRRFQSISKLLFPFRVLKRKINK